MDGWTIMMMIIPRWNYAFDLACMAEYESFSSLYFSTFLCSATPTDGLSSLRGYQKQPTQSTHSLNPHSSIPNPQLSSPPSSLSKKHLPNFSHCSYATLNPSSPP